MDFFVFQAVGFTITGSLFLYMFIEWAVFVKEKLFKSRPTRR